MALALQVVSSHLLGALDIEQALSVQEGFVKLLLPHAASEAETLKRPNCPRLFLLDGCSLNLALGPLSGRLRANSPGGKDRKSTRLNSSHDQISYAVFCLK